MASYTMPLRDYIEAQSQHIPNLKTRERIEFARKRLFDFDYEIFDEAYRGVFETHFIRNFYMREIGFETEELFKFQLETWMIINFPYFNKMFESELIKYDPLINSEINSNYLKKKDKVQDDNRDITHAKESDAKMTKKSDIKETGTDSVKGKTTDDNFDRQLESDNPDSRLTITTNDGEGAITYAGKINENNENNIQNTTSDGTNSRDTNQDDIGTSNEVENATKNDKLDSNINEVEDFITHRIGKIGVVTYAKMVKEFRENFLRLENQMFKEMQQLFMLVY